MRRLLPLLLLAAIAAPIVAQETPDGEAPDTALTTLMAEAKVDAARIRGLSFLSELPVRRITGEEFLQITMRDIGRVFGSGEELAHMETLLRALRVVPADRSLIDILREFFPATVAAKYDPFEKEILFLRGFRSKSIMVHELTHALQDQHYNLELLFEQGEMTFDRLLALGALVEGDAENVQRNFDTKGMLAMTPLPFIRQLGEQQADQYLARMKDFPRALARPFIFQYLSGLLFVETVKRANGGFPALDAVYRDPPETTEQILHPERYLDRDRPSTITAPTPPEGWSILVQNSLGELGVGLALREHLGDGYDPAAAAGWDGDRILLLAKEGADPILVWYTTWDSEKDSEEFEAAAAAMLRARWPGAKADPEAPGSYSSGDLAHLCRRSGRDVLLAEGIPAAEAGAITRALLTATVTEWRAVRSAFGGSR